MSGNTSATGGFIIDVPPGPPVGDVVDQAMQVMVSQLAGLPGNLVRPRWQPMPPTQRSPATTWAAVGVIQTSVEGYPAILHDGATSLAGLPPGVDRMQRHATLTVLVSFYGPEADFCAGQLRDALYMQQNMEPLAAIGAKLYEVEDLTRNAEVMNQQFIDRVDIRVLLRQQLDRVFPILNLNGAQVTIHNERFSEDVIVSPPP